MILLKECDFINMWNAKVALYMFPGSFCYHGVRILPNKNQYMNSRRTTILFKSMVLGTPLLTIILKT